MKDKRIHLILFFTYPVSLTQWDKAGIIDREIKIYNRLIDNKIDVSFVTYGDESDYTYKDKLGKINIIPYYSISKEPRTKIIRFLHSFLLPYKLRDYLVKASIYKTNQVWGGWNAVIAKFLYKKPLIARCGFDFYKNSCGKIKSPVLRKIIKFILSRIYRNADLIAVATQEMKEEILDEFSVKEKIFRILPNCVDTDLFRPEKKVKKAGHILFTGRLSKEKNLETLICALKDSDYSLDIVGTGEEEEKLRHTADNNHVKVNFLGNIPNNKLPELLCNYPIFILCSDYECSPKALLEAMSCGLAVIGTNVRGINSIIEDGRNGLLAENNPDPLRRAINRLMNDKALQEKLGAAAREKILMDYSLDKVLNIEIGIINSLL